MAICEKGYSWILWLGIWLRLAGGMDPCQPVAPNGWKPAGIVRPLDPPHTLPRWEEKQQQAV